MLGLFLLNNKIDLYHIFTQMTHSIKSDSMHPNLIARVEHIIECKNECIRNQDCEIQQLKA